MSRQIPAYVLTRSGRVRDSLLALLKATPGIGAVQGVTSELAEFRSIPLQNQALVLLDANLLNQELWSYLKQIKGRGANTECKCVILTDNFFQQRMARAAGVDEILLTGFPAAQFFATIENLFYQADRQPDEPGKNDTTASRQREKE